jgi:hypothetical protein
MTCEDRHFVRKKCVRCFLIRPEDLGRFGDWTWCRSKVRVEKPWHWFRVVALHCIARAWETERELTRQREAAQDTSHDMPLVDRQLRHNRIQEISLGLSLDEKPVGAPHTIDWSSHLLKLRQTGLALDEGDENPPQQPAEAT